MRADIWLPLQMLWHVTRWYLRNPFGGGWALHVLFVLFLACYAGLIAVLVRIGEPETPTDAPTDTGDDTRQILMSGL